MVAKNTNPVENVQAKRSNGHPSGGYGQAEKHGQKGANYLNPLGEKIFLDRYALKDGKKESVAVGDSVIVAVNLETGQREIGTVTALENRQVTIQLRDGEIVERPLEKIDKPIETRPEQMLDRVARGIAAVELPEKQPEWQQNFRWLLDDWKFVPGGRILTAAGTDQNLTFYNCMPPDQEILTADGYKPIAEVNVGDLVVTRHNRLRPVLHKFERETEEPLFVIKTKKLGYDHLRVTGEHKVLAIRSDWVNTHRSRDGLKLQQEAQWLPAKELNPGDYLAVAYDGQEEPVRPIYLSEHISGYEVNHGQLSKPQKRSDDHGYLEEGGTKYAIRDRLVVDRDLCYLFGRWLAHGCVTHRPKTDIPSGIKIVFALHQQEEAEQLARIIEQKFGLPASIKLSSAGRWLDLWANSMPLGQFFKAFFGCYSYGKRIPSTLMHLPKDLTFELLRGLFTADGYISGNKLGILLSNRTLAIQTHQMLLRLGYFFSIKENTHRLGRRPAYRIQANANECGPLFQDFFNQKPPQHGIDLNYYFEHEGLRWVQIDEIAIEDYSGVVLDIEVEEDHSFISAGLVVSNCYVIPSPKDSRGGIMNTLTQMTEIMSRGGGVGINISSLRPHHAYVKGVNGRSSGAVSWGELYSFVTGLIEQGGCLTPETLVFTENGLLRLEEIVKHTEPGWREQTLAIMTDEGERLSRQVFNNGVAPVLQVNTDMGLSITGTPNHKLKVMTASGPQWRRLDELQSDDAIMVKLGQHQGNFQALQKPAYQHHNQDPVTLPSILDEELAFFLGYFMGDGFMTQREGDWRLGVAVSHDSYLIEEMPALIGRLFPGVKVRTQQKENDASLIYIISNRALKEFFRLNGFDKAQSSRVCVPRLIRQSPPQVVGAFLRGLFEADGGLSHHYPSLCSVSKRLIDEVATLLIGLGCPVKVEQRPVAQDRYGDKPLWRLRVHSFRGLESWRRAIGCDARSRFAACLNFEPDKSKEGVYKLPHPEYWLEPVLTETTLPQTDFRATGQRFKATDQKLRRKLLRYLRGDRNLTLSAYDSLKQSHPAFASVARPVNDVWFVFVDNVTQAGQALTLDLEVDDNHTYLANGLVTHNSRRGALMLIMNIWHPDVMEFISSKRTMGRITNANISVGITDDFMEAVKADDDWNLVFPDTGIPDYDEVWDGDLAAWQAAGKPVIVYKTLKARDIWNTIIESAWASAEPGVFFVERYNKMSNSHYYAPILCTNPCHSGDNLIHTRKGLIPIKDLVGQEFEVVSDLRTIGGAGVHYEKAVAYPTGQAQLFTLKLKTGQTIQLTANHKLFTKRGKVALQDLKIGEDSVLIQSAPHLDALLSLDEDEIKKGQFIGWNAGDGWISQYPDERRGTGVNVGFIFNQQEELARDFVTNFINETTIASRPVAPRLNRGCWEVQTSNISTVSFFQEYDLSPRTRKRVTPEIARASVAFRIGFLQGLFSADGSMSKYKNSNTGYIILVTVNKGLAQGVQLLLADLGIKTYLRTRSEKGMRYTTQQGEIKISQAKTAYTVRVAGVEGVRRFAQLVGFPLSPSKQAKLDEVLTLAGKEHSSCTDYWSEVMEVEPAGIEPIYNLTTEISHSLIANGMVVANCGEQGLPGWGVCNLGALNLARFVSDGQVAWDDLGRAVRYAVRFLDNVIDATPYFFEENKQQQLGERRVGLGTMGLAEMMIGLKIRYGSRQSVEFLDKLYKFIAAEAYLASADNAAEKEVFPMFDGDKFLQSGFMQGMPDNVREAIRQKGIRNVTLLTQAPTGTTGTMVNTSTGIEPFYFWSFQRKGRLGLHEERVGVYDEWVTQNPDQPLPDYFVTAMDLQPEDHVRVQAAIQRWVDSSLSKTCNTPHNYTVEQTRQLYELMYDLGCKGGTIFRDGSRDVQVLNLKEEDKAAKAAAEQPPAPAPAPTPAPQVKWRARPSTLHGKTYRKNTPIGTAYITVNANGGGSQQPFEVFINVAKVGSDVAADADGLGRLISLILRMPSPIPPEERVQYIVAQLRGIGSGRQTGFGKNRIMSMPDGVAQALAEHIGVNATGDLPGLPDEDESAQQLTFLKGDFCPSCGSATLLHIEGCKKCHECGYSEC